jgi:hypothetical protein
MPPYLGLGIVVESGEGRSRRGACSYERTDCSLPERPVVTERCLVRYHILDVFTERRDVKWNVQTPSFEWPIRKTLVNHTGVRA